MAGRSLSYVRFRLARWGGVRQATGSVERNLSYVMSAPLERFVMQLVRAQNLRETTLFPRDMNRLSP